MIDVDPRDCLLRPVTDSDLESVYELAGKAGRGLTTLPYSKSLLQAKIKDSVKSFAFMSDKPCGDSYLFVLEDTENEQVLGTSAVFSKVGGFEPFWSYQLDSRRNCSQVIGVDKEIPFLRIKKVHSGPTEIGTLYLQKEYRGNVQGLLLSLGRFLFIRNYPASFEKTIIAELRGKIDDKGQYPFWNAIGANFFDVSFDTVDQMVNVDKHFISELMPTEPIYIELLPKEARDAIGSVHPNTKPARALLEQQGFQFMNEVDIFEGGPMYGCSVENIQSVTQSVVEKVHKIDGEVRWGGKTYLLSNFVDPMNFRACLGNFSKSATGEITISERIAELLKIKLGDSLVATPMFSKNQKDPL